MRGRRLTWLEALKAKRDGAAGQSIVALARHAAVARVITTTTHT
jgi:hypothetical protein